jgi:K+-sensing histidine kinase KdpD
VSADARAQGSAARGRLRIYLGYAPGAGTTCALLSEGRRRAEHGTDVVVASAACGHIYPADQVEAALGGWFRTGNLSALRELALLWLAAALAGAQRRYLPGGGDPASGQARERVVVALSGGPEGETLIRRAARIAARSGGDLLAVHAARPGRPAGSGRAVLAAQRRLAESAGGTYHQLADEDIPAALLAFAHAHNVTQLVLGATPRTWRTALRPAASIRSWVIRRGGGLDVHIVTCTPTANGVPAAACEPQHRKRIVMGQQNTSWPGRVRQAARWDPRRAAFG